MKSFDKTMENIGLDYIDLYLIHAPWPWNRIGANFAKENVKVWKAMEEIYASGRAHAIGVSNFNVSDLTNILDNCLVKPMVNQIKFFIGHAQPEVTPFCKKNDILVEGYSPLATGAILENEKLSDIAKNYGTTVPKLCIRYVLQKKVLPLPKSTHPKYIIENMDVDFEITEEDMTYLNTMKNTVRIW